MNCLCFRAVLKEMGLNDKVSPARAAKKWENLKKNIQGLYFQLGHRNKKSCICYFSDFYYF